jgi:hypothetical protein
MWTIALATLLTLIGTQSALAAKVTECDRLAAHPDDPDRIAPGVERKNMDLQQALARCEADAAQQPSQPRLRYQLARVLFYAGQNERAVAEMRAAADNGYRQAQFVYGTMINYRREHAPSDICLTERYWLAAARAGRQAARVSYVRHVLKGRFASCTIQASATEMRALLATAAGEARDFYERLLIEDLTDEFDSTGLSRPQR